MFFFRGDASHSDQKEKHKSNGDFPRLNSRARVDISLDQIHPRPQHTSQSSDNKGAETVGDPTHEEDRHGVKEQQRYLVTGSEIEPSNGEKQRQRLGEGKYRWLARQETEHNRVVQTHIGEANFQPLGRLLAGPLAAVKI